MRLLFVCTGNTCRSAMAEAIAKRAAAEVGLASLEIASAGLAAADGAPATPGAQHAMEADGLSLARHRARRLTPELVAQADLILTMTRGHARAVRTIAPQDKVYTLYEYAGEAGDVHDPYGASEDVYAECARRMEPRILRALERIRRETGEQA